MSGWAAEPRGEYPQHWAQIAKLVKDEAEWKCERCGHPHDFDSKHVLTVHHLDGDKSNCERWNLAALCQRCHLSVQGRVDFARDYTGPHSFWMAIHVVLYNAWALPRKRPMLSLTEVVRQGSLW